MYTNICFQSIPLIDAIRYAESFKIFAEANFNVHTTTIFFVEINGTQKNIVRANNKAMVAMKVGSIEP